MFIFTVDVIFKLQVSAYFIYLHLLICRNEQLQIWTCDGGLSIDLYTSICPNFYVQETCVREDGARRCQKYVALLQPLRFWDSGWEEEIPSQSWLSRRGWSCPAHHGICEFS